MMRPLNRNLHVIRKETDMVSAGGIVFVGAQTRNEAVVLHVGPKVESDEVIVGETVVLDPKCKAVPTGARDHFIVSVDDVLAIRE